MIDSVIPYRECVLLNKGVFDRMTAKQLLYAQDTLPRHIQVLIIKEAKAVLGVKCNEISKWRKRS